MTDFFSGINFLRRDRSTPWPDYLLALFMGGLFFTIIAVEVAAAIYLFLFLAILFSQKNTRWDFGSYLILIYVSLGIVGFFRSGSANLLTHLLLIAFIPLWLGMKKKGAAELTRWLRLIALFAAITALIGIINHFLGEERTSGTFGGYFTLATLMTWGIPVTAALFFEEKKNIRWLYLTSIFLQIIALWWTYTRSAILGLFVGFAAWGFFRILRFWRQSRSDFKSEFLSWSALAIPLLLLLALILTSSDPRMNPLAPAPTHPVDTVDLSSGRTQILQEARTLLTRDWQEGNYLPLLVGYGLSSRQRLVGGPFTSWESDYLQALMDHGLLGLLTVIFLYVLYLRLILRGIGDKDFITNGLAVAGVVTLVMSFLTLRITGWHSAGVFVINYSLLLWSQKSREAGST